MDKDTRNRIQRATQAARGLLEQDFEDQLAGVFDIRLDGTIAGEPGSHLDAAQRIVRTKLVAAVEHFRASGQSAAEAAASYRREAAFTTLNRFVALKMLEARGLVQECISRGEQSSGFKEFCGLAPGLVQLPDRGYRLYIESLFDEIGREVRVLFDRRDPASLLWPARATLFGSQPPGLLEILNDPELAGVWDQDETIGWVYQYYNDPSERKRMRDESAAPRNSRELAVRNQFFTPRYVVEFLTDNSLGRLWYEMTRGVTRLKEQCRYLVWRVSESPVVSHQSSAGDASADDRALKTDAPIRPLKDPREIRMLDPACGSMHFGLYAFDLYQVIYEEAWDLDLPPPAGKGGGGEGLVPLRALYATKDDYLRDIPRLIIEHNIHGIDIDPRAAQIAGLSLWLRAQRAWQEQGLRREDRPRVRRSNIACAEPMPGEGAYLDECIATHLSATPEQRLLGQLVRRVFTAMRLAGEAGSLLKIEDEIAGALAEAKQQWFFGLKKPEQLQLFADDSPSPEQLVLGLDVIGIADATFWDQAEGLIYAARHAYAERAERGGGYQRRLFAEDAARGFAFIDIYRQGYDVVLMNPPFGAFPEHVRPWAQSAYPRTRNDIYAAFIERGIGLLRTGGYLGAITSRTGFFLTSFQRWREEILLQEALPTVVADLGHGVMDDAMVEAAAYCLVKQ
ncbi:SAM-dependent methyltransferase [uncultured Thiodictyon sp.]|uniref:Eco57I restriction-modification methylase domain-containing protein n=1 Tax=uncultured Thiodictyon sp. TaxID=1846217 RepID=UPI0025E4A15B|nr:SAM-dependent methyltransferase [uncultured Thiodictyon sp.]